MANMFQADPTQDLAVSIEWDKNERQRARNRINQRNYRRRKSEQLKESQKKQRAKSDSRSPASTADLTQSEAESSIRQRRTPSATRATTSKSEWPSQPSAQLNSLPSARASRSILESNNVLGSSWPSVHGDSHPSPLLTPDPQLLSSSWQSEHDFTGQMDFLNLQTQDHSWTGSSSLNSTPPIPELPLPEVSTTLPRYGMTTLHLAAQNGHSQSIRVLLYHGADPDIKDHEGRTPLHVAATYGHMEAIAILINGGCNINATTSSGQTALHLAAANNHIRVIDQLLRSGGDPNIQISS